MHFISIPSSRIHSTSSRPLPIGISTSQRRISTLYTFKIPFASWILFAVNTIPMPRLSQFNEFFVFSVRIYLPFHLQSRLELLLASFGIFPFEFLAIHNFYLIYLDYLALLFRLLLNRKKYLHILA